MTYTAHKKIDLSVCYFGISRSRFSRNATIINGLRENGVRVIEIFDNSKGFRKFINIFVKHWKIRNQYDVMIVGYPSYILVFFARLISSKKVVFDALCSLYESEVISRRRYTKNFLGKFMIWLIDWVAYQSAHIVLLETNQQISFYSSLLKIKGEKCRRVFTGADETIFFYDPKISKEKEFTVLFRGKYMAEAGFDHVLEAAKILETSGTKFKFMSPSYKVPAGSSSNIKFITEYLDEQTLRVEMQSCHISLGQFEDHERLIRTIPHKAFESMAMKLPYITGRAKGIQELLVEGENCVMVNLSDGADLASKILDLKNKPEKMDLISENAYSVYSDMASMNKIGKKVKEICQQII